MTARRRSVTAACLVGLAVACAPAGGAGQAGTGASDGAPRPTGELTVFAAASLTDAVTDLRAAFVTDHPDVEVVVNHAGSQRLAGQLLEGATADVFAAADPEQMARVVDEGLAADPAVFATNRLAIAVEPGNPHGIGGLADLADPGLVVVLPADAVPAGRYARLALDALGVPVQPSSLEADVRAALAKVELGEADAAVVYASDVLAAHGRAEGIEIPPDDNVVSQYPIAVLTGAPNPVAAEAFVAFVRSEAGQAVLADHGFAAP